MDQQRTALITGANRGIGKAVAAELHQRGFDVVLSGRAPEVTAKAAAELGPGVRSCELDVSDPGSVAAARERLGRIDVLVSNAGIRTDADTSPLTVSLERAERMMSVNFFGSWRVAQAFVPGMIDAGWGRVVFVSSATGSFTVGLYPNSSGYAVSETALNGLTKLLATATAGTRVLVNAVNPGPTRTRMMPTGARAAAEAAADVIAAVTLPDDGPAGTFRRGGTKLGW